MSSYMPIKWITWIYGQIFRKVLLSKTEPVRNRKSEQIKHRHGNRNYNKNLPKNKSPRPDGFLGEFYQKMYRRANTYSTQTLPENCREM